MVDDPSPVEQLRLLRAEHRPILEAIVADEGMSASTRSLLVAHLVSEEDERLADVTEAAAGAADPASSTEPATPSLRVAPRRRRIDGTPAGTGLTVGSLRGAR